MYIELYVKYNHKYQSHTFTTCKFLGRKKLQFLLTTDTWKNRRPLERNGDRNVSRGATASSQYQIWGILPKILSQNQR